MGVQINVECWKMVMENQYGATVQIKKTTSGYFTSGISIPLKDNISAVHWVCVLPSVYVDCRLKALVSTGGRNVQLACDW